MPSRTSKKQVKTRNYTSYIVIGFLILCITVLLGIVIINIWGKQQIQKPTTQLSPNYPTFQRVPEEVYKNSEWKNVTFTEFNDKSLQFSIPQDWEASFYTSAYGRPEIEVFPSKKKAFIQSLSSNERLLNTIIITVLPEKMNFDVLYFKVGAQSDRRYDKTIPIKVHQTENYDAILSEREPALIEKDSSYSEFETQYKEILLVQPSEDIIYVRTGKAVADTENVFNTIISSISLE